MFTRLPVAVAVLALTLLAGCGAGEFCDAGLCLVGPSDEDGSLSFALSSTDTTVRSFVIKLYKGATERARGNAYFESGCSPVSKGFSISHVDVSDEYVVEYLGYSDRTCSASTLIRTGVRGGVRVTAAGTGYAYYFIQVNTVGGFTAMPVPDANLNPATGGVQCSTDSDCRRVIPCEDPDECRFKVAVDCDQTEIDAGECPDGYKVMQYNVHPKAVCDYGICRLATLFPLNTRGGRAYAATMSTDAGDVISIGGFTKVVDGSYVVEGASDPASAPETQMFMGDQGIFGVLEHDRPLDAGLGMSASAMLDDGRLIVAGGTRKATARAADPSDGAPVIDSLFCTTDCPVEMSDYLYVIDSATGAVDRTRLAEPLIPAAVVPVARATTSVYIRGGASMRDFGGDQASGASTLSWVCQISDANAASCVDVNPSSQVARFMPAGVCIRRTNGLCASFLTLGGTDNANKFAEIYDAERNLVKVMPATGDVPGMLSGATAFMAGDAVWLLGGTSDDRMSQPAVPYKVMVDEGAGVVILKAVVLNSADSVALSRHWHQATVLADDKTVLVTGGIGASGSVTDTAVLLSAAGGEMKVVDAGLKMSEPRMGHSATLVTGGLFDGAVLVTGGVTSADGTFAEGAEMYLPAE